LPMMTNSLVFDRRCAPGRDFSYHPSDTSPKTWLPFADVIAQKNDLCIKVS